MNRLDALRMVDGEAEVPEVGTSIGRDADGCAPLLSLERAVCDSEPKLAAFRCVRDCGCVSSWTRTGT